MSQPSRKPVSERPVSEARPDLRLVGRPEPARGGGWIAEWDPENEGFWKHSGARVARRNLAVSVSALFLAFVVWMVWSTVVVELPNVGFKFSTDQLFWLTALPGLSGATLRIFYSFMVPVLGGRAWTALTTGSLLLPMIGIGFAVQSPGTPTPFFSRSRCYAVLAAATSPPAWLTSVFSIPRRPKARPSGSTGAWATWASVLSSS